MLPTKNAGLQKGKIMIETKINDPRTPEEILAYVTSPRSDRGLPFNARDLVHQFRRCAELGISDSDFEKCHRLRAGEASRLREYLTRLEMFSSGENAR